MKVMKNAHISCEGGGATFVLITFVDVAFQMWNVADVGFQTERSKNALYWQGLHTPAFKAEMGSKNDHFLGQVRIWVYARVIIFH